MHVSTLPAGTRIPAGLGYAVVHPDLDFETKSEAGYIWVAAPTPKNPNAGKWHGLAGAPQGKKGLGVVGAAVYAEHPTTDILSLAYNLKDGRGSRLWVPGGRRPADLIDHIARGGILEAWNSGFEWWIWNLVGVRRYDFPPLYIVQLRCAMAKARASGYPGKLGDAGGVMGLEVQKDKAGHDLLKIFSIPQTPTIAQPKLWLDPTTHPCGPHLYHYNEVDIMTEAEASSRCPELEGEELDFWIADQIINRRGVHVDKPGLEACAAIVNQVLAKYDAELYTLTGGQVERASQLERLKGWLAGHGVVTPSLDDDHVTDLLKRMPPTPPGFSNPVRRALELRQLCGSASVKKVFAMLNQVSSRSRLHDLFNYHGARTGRPTGEGPQPTNLPKEGPPVRRCICGRWHGTHRPTCPWCGAPVMPAAPGVKVKHKWTWKAVDDVLEVIHTRSLDMVQMFFGDAMACVAGVLRGLFNAAPGHDLIASDFSAIESVVTAVLAGEQWRVDMFKTHGKNYEAAAAQISGIPFAEMMAHAGYDVTQPEWWLQEATGDHHPLRQTLGKVSELASGFGGWIGAWVKFGADEFMTEEEIKTSILAWREASPAIVEFWGGQVRRKGYGQMSPELFGLEGMAIKALLNPGLECPVLRLDGTFSGVTYVYKFHNTPDAALYCILPSGRPLTYRRPRLEASQAAWRGNYAISFEGWNSNAQKGAVGWQTMYLYGGLLCENVVQAVARDIQRYAIINLERAGYAVVLHVYDEDVAEVPQGWGSVEGLEAIMQTLPPWAVYRGEPWPIRAAGGWRSPRYRKG